MMYVRRASRNGYILFIKNKFGYFKGAFTLNEPWSASTDITVRLTLVQPKQATSGPLVCECSSYSGADQRLIAQTSKLWSI